MLDDGRIMVCGMSAVPRIVHCEVLHHHVSVNIIGGSGIHLNHVGFEIQGKD